MLSRPTAVDLSNAIKLLKKKSADTAANSLTPDQTLACADIRLSYIEGAEKVLEDDHTTNLAIGRYGAEYLRRQQVAVHTPVTNADSWRYFTTSPPGTQGAPDQTYRKLSVLTHCNTGYTILSSSSIRAQLTISAPSQLPATAQP
jgi:methylthioribose-1-phosphate isomerase